jgi:hypothetical protein
MHTLIGPLPRHLYAYVDTGFTHRQPQSPRFQPCVWFGLVSYPGRMWGCTVLLESGAVYRALPPHALALTATPDTIEPDEAQTWDCYGDRFSTVEYPYLAGLACLAKTGKRQQTGHYLFSVAPVGDGFSAYPEQAKEFHFLALDGGRLTIQPTDRVIYQEKSFTGHDLAFPTGLRRQTEVYTCE